MSNINKKFAIIKVSPKFNQFLKEIKPLRIKNGIDKKYRSDRELTEMLMNTPSFSKVKLELFTLPKKEDIK